MRPSGTRTLPQNCTDTPRRARYVHHMNILAISGSARRASTNTALLHALAQLAPSGTDIQVFSGIGALPVFSPDLEGTATPDSVLAFIEMISRADGIIISCPEYVRAIPGGMKNAIDWLVSGEAIIGKPIMLAHASHRGDDMLAALRVVLATVSSGFREEIFLRTPLVNKTQAEITAAFSREAIRAPAKAFLEQVVLAIHSAPST